LITDFCVAAGERGGRGGGRGGRGQGRGQADGEGGGGGGGWSQSPAQQQYVLNMPTQLNPNAAAFFGQSPLPPSLAGGALFSGPPAPYDMQQQPYRQNDHRGGGGRDGYGGRGRRGR
jgi:hypothetical protein